MAQATQPYKRSVAGSVGAGMGSLFGGSGKPYFILEHKVGSKYHKAGETQEIIIDQIEIGRDSKCQVRYDEHFETVSRRHAAIVKEGNNWKLVPLSQTNPTFLNGKRVQKEWFLQNGDEIQCAVNGPKLGFIIPTGKKSTVGSIGLSRRFSLFRKQALRPYKQAITTLTCVLLLCLGGGGYFIWNQNKAINIYAKVVADNKAQIDSLLTAQAQDQKLREEMEGQLTNLKRALENMIIHIPDPSPDTGPIPVADLSICHPHVYILLTFKITIDDEVFFETDIENGQFFGCGTGFMLNDGRFVTARHCVTDFYSNSYGFDQEENIIIFDLASAIVGLYLNYMAGMGKKVKTHFFAISTEDQFEITSDVFVSDDSHDQLRYLERSISHQIFPNQPPLTVPAGALIREGALDASDWAYCKTSKKEGLIANSNLSSNLRQGTELYILGHPDCRGVEKPILSTAVCAQNGLNYDDGTIMASNDNTTVGNSGGPIFIRQNSNYEVVGVLSGSTGNKGRFVPISALK